MIPDIIDQLESNNRETIDSIKQKIRELLTKNNDPWLVTGFYDYYLSTNSVRSMEILVTLKEPHHFHLFDKLQESIKSPKVDIRVQALTLLGHIARCQPKWLYVLPTHPLFKELLKLLNIEIELLPLLSALLVLIVLLPILPSAMALHLNQIFDIFSRLASMNCSPSKSMEDQLIHMQVALYALFLRLYGMYPCNFVAYLRNNYRDRNNPIFVHTIKPMLNTVRMHSSFVTSSTDEEITRERWCRMTVHEIILECERFSLDMSDRCPHDTCQYVSGFRSRSGTTNSTIEPSYQTQCLKGLTDLINVEPAPFSPTYYHIQASGLMDSPVGQIVRSSFQQESPPEAAVEATPETTPVRGPNSPPLSGNPLNINVARAITSYTLSNPHSLSATPTHSQPSSPMRKERSPYNFNASEGATVAGKQAGSSSSSSGFIRQRSEAIFTQRVTKLNMERSQVIDSSMVESFFKSKMPSSNPLRISNQEQRFVYQKLESQVSKDEEQNMAMNKTDEGHNETANQEEDKSEEQEHGSPCSSGGLHMPNSKSMNNFARTLRRLRHHSQSHAEPDRVQTSTGSSPGNIFTDAHFPGNSVVRRAHSCPEMEKGRIVPLKESKDREMFCETDEETASEEPTECMTTTSNGDLPVDTKPDMSSTASTYCQTDNFWPLPYEHLFLDIFPSTDVGDSNKASPDLSSAPLNFLQERYQPSVYDILDKYIESAVSGSNESNHIQMLKYQLQLLHQQLVFERYRRETHAYRNRRLLSDSKTTKILEECNSALRDRVQLQETDLMELRRQNEMLRREHAEELKKLNNTASYWEREYKSLDRSFHNIKDKCDGSEREMNELKARCASIEIERQEDKACLLDAVVECNVAKEQVIASEQVRQEYEQLSKNMLLLGELHLRYKERLESLSALRQTAQELKMVKEAFKEDVKILHHQMDSKATTLEACKVRMAEMEKIIGSKDETLVEQKRALSAMERKHQEELEAVESKYATQLVIIRTLEETIMELYPKYESESGARNISSPDSCQEALQVLADATSSQHSSPNTDSLTDRDTTQGELQNIQMVIDKSGS